MGVGRPFASQVQDAVAVVDLGPFSEPDMVPAAREAGVRRNKDFVASRAHEEAGIIAGHQEEVFMRVMAKITVPVESGNHALRDGSIGKIIQATAERWKPEAIYIGPFDGRRTVFIVFDLPNPSDILVFTEPWFQGMNAEVEINPVMSVDDVQRELAKLG